MLSSLVFGIIYHCITIVLQKYALSEKYVHLFWREVMV